MSCGQSSPDVLRLLASSSALEKIRIPNRGLSILGASKKDNTASEARCFIPICRFLRQFYQFIEFLDRVIALLGCGSFQHAQGFLVLALGGQQRSQTLLPQAFVRGASRPPLDSGAPVVCNPVLDSIRACLVEQLFTRWTAPLGRTGIFQKVQCAGKELETRRGIENRRPQRAPRIGRSKVVGALPGLECLEPVSAHLLREGEISNSLPILRLVRPKLGKCADRHRHFRDRVRDDRCVAGFRSAAPEPFRPGE